MIRSGLVSVTFRNLSAEEIIALVCEVGLEGIEWGGDIHVPHGDLERALEVGNLTRQAGLQVASYGSYYRVGCDTADGQTFDSVLETAIKLGAPTIRVWAGNRGSANADSEWWAHVVDDSRRIADMAHKEGITISFEYHGNSLTDTSESAMKLLQLCKNDHINTLWQPSVYTDYEERQESLKIVSPWLSNLHVFHWHDREKCPLRSGEREWLSYLETASLIGGDRYALLEFVMNDSVEQFKDDALALQELLMKVNTA